MSDEEITYENTGQVIDPVSDTIPSAFDEPTEKDKELHIGFPSSWATTGAGGAVTGAFPISAASVGSAHG